jgi:hypothetical protein
MCTQETMVQMVVVRFCLKSLDLVPKALREFGQNKENEKGEKKEGGQGGKLIDKPTRCWFRTLGADLAKAGFILVDASTGNRNVTGKNDDVVARPTCMFVFAQSDSAVVSQEFENKRERLMEAFIEMCEAMWDGEVYDNPYYNVYGKAVEGTMTIGLNFKARTLLQGKVVPRHRLFIRRGILTGVRVWVRNLVELKPVELTRVRADAQGEPACPKATDERLHDCHQLLS